MPAIAPSNGLPVAPETQTAVNAPPIMMPSSPMLTTPERSESTPPSAAKISGVALTSVSPASAISATTNAVHVEPPRRDVAPSRERDDHETLDHVDDVARHVGFGLHRERAVLQDAERERRDDDPERFEVADQRDRDRDEAVARTEPGVEAVQHAGDERCAAEAGDRAGERHREQRDAAQIDARAARGFGRFAGRAQFEAEHRAIEDEAQREREHERDDERDREPRVGNDRRQPRGLREQRRLAFVGGREVQRTVDRVRREQRRDRR